jgi:hypothetical protein
VVAPALDVGAVLPGEVLVVLVVVVVGVLEICVVVVAVVVEAAGLVGVVDPGAGADVVVAEEPGAVAIPLWSPWWRSWRCASWSVAVRSTSRRSRCRSASRPARFG